MISVDKAMFTVLSSDLYGDGDAGGEYYDENPSLKKRKGLHDVVKTRLVVVS